MYPLPLFHSTGSLGEKGVSQGGFESSRVYQYHETPQEPGSCDRGPIGLVVVRVRVCDTFWRPGVRLGGSWYLILPTSSGKVVLVPEKSVPTFGQDVGQELYRVFPPVTENISHSWRFTCLHSSSRKVLDAGRQIWFRLLPRPRRSSPGLESQRPSGSTTPGRMMRGTVDQATG